MSQLIDLSLIPTLDADGNPASGASLRFYAKGTLTPVTVYRNSSLATPHDTPILSDAAGRFPAVYVGGTQALRARLDNGGGVIDIEQIYAPISSDDVAHGSGTVADAISSLDARLDTLPINVEEFGADGTIAGDSAALKAAIAAASANRRPVLLPGRRIYWDSTPITVDVRLWGQGQPAVNSARTALVGGTIIQGGLIFTGANVDIRDFGVDLGTEGGAPDIDGVKATAPLNAGGHFHAENITTLCRSSASAVHSTLFESYQRVSGGNLLAVNGYFGVVIKCRDVKLSGITCDHNSDTGLYLKSDDTYGACENIQIDKVVVTNGGTMGVRVQSDSAPMRNVQLRDIRASDCDRSVALQLLNFAGADLKNVLIDGVISTNSATADVSILSLRDGSVVDHVRLSNIVAINPGGKVIETSNQPGTPGAKIRNISLRGVYGSYAAGTLQATMDGAVFFDAGVLSTDVSGVEIVENYGLGSKIGALNYQNVDDPKAHVLGAHKVQVIGAGRPQSGNLNQDISGSTATLLISADASGADRSKVRATLTAPATITTFTSEWPSQTNAFGHLLHLYNNSNYTLTVAHNPGSGIVNQGGASVVLAANEVAAWMQVGGGVWVQQKIA